MGKVTAGARRAGGAGRVWGGSPGARAGRGLPERITGEAAAAEEGGGSGAGAVSAAEGHGLPPRSAETPVGRGFWGASSSCRSRRGGAVF